MKNERSVLNWALQWKIKAHDYDKYALLRKNSNKNKIMIAI